MEHKEELDQFMILEERVGALVDRVSSLKDEKEQLAAKVREQDKTISDLKAEMDDLRDTRDKAKARIQTILDKIGKMDI
jgi:uncharacterized coiled-coil DUF342 family protein